MLLYFFFMEIYIENKMLMKGKNFVKRIVSVGVKIGFLMWYVFVKFYIKVGEVGKVEMILNKVMSDNKMRLLFIFYMVIFEEYVKRGDVYNVEKVFMRMKRVGYVVQLMQYEIVLLVYVNVKMFGYGMSERMKVDNVFLNKSFVVKFVYVDLFRKSLVFVLFDE